MEIETTLQDAVERCYKNGGRFRPESCCVWYVVQGTTIINTEDDANFVLGPNDFRSKWFYKPPQKSAFHEWRDKQNPAAIQEKHIWNAAIEAVLNLEIKATGDVVFSPPRAILPDQVKKLIEE